MAKNTYSSRKPGADIILETMSESFFELDENNIFRRINEHAIKLWRLEKSPVGKNITDVFPYIEESPFYNILAKANAQKKNFAQDVPDPVTGRWLHISVTPYSDGLVVIFYDIQNEKEADRQILQLKDEIAQKATDKYKVLFNSIDQGFNIIELIFDDNGKVIDYWQREHNPVFTKLTGLQDVIGKRMSELVPYVEPEWHRMIEKIYYTGEPIQIEYPVQALGKWFRTYMSRIGGEGSPLVACIYDDITERKQRELQQDYLMRLSDTLRAVPDAVEIEEKVTALAMEFFDADRCYYCTIEGEVTIVRRDARKGNLPSVAGSYPISSFALFKKVIDEGVPLVVHDARTTPVLDEPLREICIQLQIISFVNIPVMKNGKAAGIFCLVQSTPRIWKETDTRLAGETAERTWAAVERARAEEALQRLNASLEEEVTRRTADQLRQLGVIRQSEEKIQQLDKNLSHSNRSLASSNAELAAFNSIAANDYNELLKHLYISLEMIITNDASRLSNTGRANLRRAQGSIQKMKLLTDDLVSYSRLHETDEKQEEIDLNETFNAVGENFRKQHPDTVMKVDCTSLNQITGYPKLIHRLFYYLMESAERMQREAGAGELHVTCEPFLKGETISHKDAKKEMMYHVISVSHDGNSFEEEEVQNIFDILYTLRSKTSKRISGIGLAVCRKIMEIHDGFIMLESREGHGATFHCYFPAQ